MPHILIIDNDPSIGAAMRFMLDGAGHTSTVAHNAQAADEELASSPFDLVILDMLMPGTSGLEILKRVRHAHPCLPVVAMSGFRLRNAAHPSDALHRAATIGAAFCLRKPFTRADLLLAVTSTLGPRATAPALLATAR